MQRQPYSSSTGFGFFFFPMQSARLRPLYSVSEYCFQLKIGAHAKFHPTVLVCSNSCRVPMAQKYPEKSKIFHRWHVSASTKRLTHSKQSQSIHHQPQKAYASRMHQEGNQGASTLHPLSATMQHGWPQNQSNACLLSAECSLAVVSPKQGVPLPDIASSPQSPGLYATWHRLIRVKLFRPFSATDPCYKIDGMGDQERLTGLGELQGADTEDNPIAFPLMPAMLLRLRDIS